MLKATVIVILLMLHLGLMAQPNLGVVYAPESVDWTKSEEREDKIPLFAVKTNLLYDAIITPNVTIELPIGGHWSLCAEWIFAWWDDSKHLRCYENLCGGLQGRYWFEPHTSKYPMQGWFVGGYTYAGYYDLERRARGTRGEMWGISAVGGYTHLLWRNLRMEYSAALGFIHSSYNKYNELLDCQEQLRLLRYKKGQHTWWGPTRIDVSLVWMLYGIKRRER